VAPNRSWKIFLGVLKSAGFFVGKTVEIVECGHLNLAQGTKTKKNTQQKNNKHHCHLNSVRAV